VWQLHLLLEIGVFGEFFTFIDMKSKNDFLIADANWENHFLSPTWLLHSYAPLFYWPLHIKYFFYSACNILASPSLDFKLTDLFCITKGVFCLIFQHVSQYFSLLLFDSVQGARSDSYFTVEVYAELGKYLLGFLCLILSIPCECTMF